MRRIEEGGLSTKNEIGEKNKPSVGSYLSIASNGLSGTYGPTAMYKENLEIAKRLIIKLKAKVDEFTLIKIPAIEKQLKEAGAPVIL